ncbi:MAG: hypothetical protein PHO90_00495 [Candidatus Pacebacteria bacterium]|nr:hypothetical protein [Candidatus Paceibacterota bacterium]
MAKTFEECLIDTRKVEAVINRNLFISCAIITLVAMAMVVIEFFSRGNFFPSRIGFFYIGVLFIYSAHKELLRWLGEKETRRAGEFFLYSWIGLTLLFYVINFWTKDYYSTSLEGKPLGCISEAALITLEVAAIFLLARISKVIKLFTLRKKKKS